ncbi:amino acid ABC transporter membrane protein 1, PAAT family [Bradyrhizobium sp. Ghvi]|uniref:ABC transporter permease n=1 Tax=Bradyrhizobium sp. Ghvi TaxID=1855319 RepID=UPI0008F1BCD9|nr:ABC transporter permease subunit [Bradyrhizobium sp. Ghvi]SFP37591.1 amino acid ABC transporter membrane protein 1, PAAT family [Bradyrhizobium sp. Ghvi]
MTMDWLSGYGLQLIFGAVTMLSVALVALVVGTVLGISLGTAKIYGAKPLRYSAEAYTAVVRGVPDLIVIYLIYFGGTVALTKITGQYVDINGFAAGVAALAFIFAAYAGDIFRGAIGQVPRGQTEAAHALGLSPRAAFFRIILPQAWRLALPGFGNLAIILIKQTSLISVIGLEELLRASSVISGATRQPFLVYSVAAILYLIITSIVSWGFRNAGIRSNRGFA